MHDNGLLLLKQDQYMLIHDAVLESLICGNTRVIASSFSTAMDQLSQVSKLTGKTGYEIQFEVCLWFDVHVIYK